MGFTKRGWSVGAAGFLAGGFSAGAVAVVLLWTGTVGAGPLDPPAGPVAPTFKTMTDVEPRIALSAANTPGDADSVFKITQSGSYYLTGNLAGVSGKSGIEIAASNVTIDLRGFTMQGVTGSLDGIASPFGAIGITIQNGFITGWSDGIDLTLGGQSRVSGVNASDNTGGGIRLGNEAIVRECTAFSNGGSGISVSGTGSGVIESCIARSNTLDGIILSASGVVRNCEARGNSGAGIRSSSSGYSLITECSSVENVGDGIRVGNGATVSRNTCSFNGDAGIGAGIRAIGVDNRIEENNCASNERGIEVTGTSNFIARNTVTGSVVNNWVISANNVILVVVASNAGAFTGFSGGTAPGSTDPNANFSY
jgi:parallel beta-helix repeat protein